MTKNDCEITDEINLKDDGSCSRPSVAEMGRCEKWNWDGLPAEFSVFTWTASIRPSNPVARPESAARRWDALASGPSDRDSPPQRGRKEPRVTRRALAAKPAVRSFASRPLLPHRSQVTKALWTAGERKKRFPTD
ncbi:hypothetical protein SKAU_G00270330 [Synaphobranchus kaupii]|uniref:Uncharacterized protein n=1 Tax=Synaphobranchus kaupii TaxID=118154 RepID=A0A9Q1F024_SYNKA|nr:hypothetical protein SKAU_G00270330 [Synaphobranchus kaupii]